MYKIPKFNKTNLNVNNVTEGERLEDKIDRIVNNGEKVTDAAQPIYTERKDGVLPAYNIRTDRFEVAVEGMDAIHKSAMAKREERHKPRTADNEPDAKIGGTESIQGSENQ